MYIAVSSFTYKVLIHVTCSFTRNQVCGFFFDEKHSTIRCSDCELLVHIDSHATYDMPRCSRCRQYCNNLRALVSRSEKQRESDSTDPSSHTPFRHLSSPDKAIRYQREHALRRSYQRQIAHLSKKA